MNQPHIAVIGSGISGLSAAWLLSKSSRVTLFEKAPTLGGHTNTVVAETPDGPVPVDTGFIVFNEQNYPNLTALFAHLGVETAASNMSFAVTLDGGRMEYSGKQLNGLFGQRRNILRFEHWQLVRDILRFFRRAERDVASCPPEMSIGEFLEKHDYSRAFIDDHILPMSAAIWSTPSRGMLDFPARTFIAFFANHSLLQVGNRPVWRTVRGGSRTYLQALLADSGLETVTSAGIISIRRDAQGVDIAFANGETRRFDQVVMACHANDALALLEDRTEAENQLLGQFRYVNNHAVLHTDTSFMPRRRHLWSSWNYLRSGSGEDNLSLTYWMNRLQPLATNSPLFVTLNPHRDFAQGSVQYRVDYEHPLFDAGAIAAQSDLWQIQGTNRTWFAGAWMGYGFHEDGLQAGLEVAERIGPVARPWSTPNQRYRIAHNWAGADQHLKAAE